MNNEWFNNFYALVEEEVRKKGKVFYLNSVEGHDQIWLEKQLELWDLSGWLVDPEEEEDFKRCYDEHGAEFYNKYFFSICYIGWFLDEGG